MAGSLYVVIVIVLFTWGLRDTNMGVLFGDPKPVATSKRVGTGLGIPASLPCERLGRGLCGAVTRLALRWFKSPMRLKLRSCHGHADPGLTMTPQCSACTALVVTR